MCSDDASGSLVCVVMMLVDIGVRTDDARGCWVYAVMMLVDIGNTH